MKTCTRCKVEKVESEFSLLHPAKRDSKLRPDCKECVRERSRRQYAKDPDAFLKRTRSATAKSKARNRAIVTDYLSSHPCVDCGESDIDVLDFDHCRGKKACDVSKMVGYGAREWRLLAEIDKCDIRCANCHRKITAKRRREKNA